MGSEVGQLVSFVEKTTQPPIYERFEKVLARWQSPPDSISKADLVEIAREKNGGKLAPSRSGAALDSNGDAVVQRLSKLAFAENDEEVRIRILLGLSGVGVPVASAILAWTNPSKYGVIDKWACRTVLEICGIELNPRSPVSWITYLAIIREVSVATGLRPFDVDRRLYAYRPHQ